MPRLASGLLCVLAGAACGDGSSPGTVWNPSTDGGIEGESSGPSGTTSGGEGTADSASSADSADAADGADTGEVLFDLGVPDSPPPQSGCRGIDFLFVIDNSASMFPRQAELIASFDEFIEAIEGTIGNVERYQVGVITSDDYGHNAPQCRDLGDLVSQTQAMGDCMPFAQGGRFATEQDDLSAKFPCMATVGTTGSGGEKPVSATVEALSPAKLGPGGCNEGFVRDDSILVIVVVTDDPSLVNVFDDAEPTLDTSGWAPAVLAAKDDNADAVVVIGFIPWDDVSCVGNQVESPNLIEFVDAFGEQGVKASICEADYGPVFASTVSTIKATCDNYTPVG